VEDLQERLRPLAKGIELDASMLETLLAPAAPRDIFARMLRNLRAIHESRKDDLKALAASSRILMLLPDAAEEHRHRAELYEKLECVRAALSDWQRYLTLEPHARDAEHARTRVAALEPLVARLN
jgi:regulator of sirC expression with transglutaminase-like and TPR domain